MEKEMEGDGNAYVSRGSGRENRVIKESKGKGQKNMREILFGYVFGCVER